MNNKNGTVKKGEIDEALDEVVEESIEKVDEWELKYKRALADYQNLEKRVRDDSRNLILSANRNLLLRFLPIFDTLELANQHEPSSALAVSISQFSDTLKSEGVKVIETKDKKFDPHSMEVLSTVDGKEGVVIQEVRKGYLLHDILLRPAQVIVGKGK